MRANLHSRNLLLNRLRDRVVTEALRHKLLGEEVGSPEVDGSGLRALESVNIGDVDRDGFVLVREIDEAEEDCRVLAGAGPKLDAAALAIDARGGAGAAVRVPGKKDKQSETIERVEGEISKSLKTY